MPKLLALTALSLALTGCFDPSAEVPTPPGAPSSYSGQLKGDGTCNGGALYFLVDRADVDDWAATLYYESSPLGGERYRATYRVEGHVDETGVQLEDAEMLEADPLPPELIWCTSRYRLDLPGASRRLGGRYESEHCGCSGTLALDAAN